ncbi:MAG: ATP synthase F1 subunit epsilon [Acidobacteria bacterium]|nr:ATP synthase F1 subunit epsilon [Acidobacteriota bacterium]
MTKSRTLHCSVVTPEATIFDGPTVSVVFPAYDGEMGILPNHAPLLTRLGVGELRITRPEGEVLRYYVEFGFAQVVDNRLTILTEQALPVAKLDRAAADAALAAAQAMPGGTAEATEARDKALARARVQRKLAP